MTYYSVFVNGQWKDISEKQWKDRKQAEFRVIEFFTKLLWED